MNAARKKAISQAIPLILLVSLFLCPLLTSCSGSEKTYFDNVDRTSWESDVSIIKEPQFDYSSIEKVDSLPDDFIFGADISSMLSVEESGAVYKDGAGNPADLFALLKAGGFDTVRLRLWNDPYDSEGRGYGGGNCDLERVAFMASRAAKAGLDSCIDFHYSDFWADPKKQMVPKAWKDKGIDEKKDVIYEYTKTSLERIISAGGHVTMVQIGNETQNGMCGEDRENMAELMKAGSRAVREISPDIKIILHFTEPQQYGAIEGRVVQMKNSGVDFDICGISYYPYWHGTHNALSAVLSDIEKRQGVKTCIMETSYMFTGKDGDGSGNSVTDKDIVSGYEASPEGQIKMIRDTVAAANKGGALGVFYWEPAWIPVEKRMWEEQGAGWASSFASSYDPEDAGKYYGGSAVDNQALFDFEGNALPSLFTFKYLRPQ